MSSESEYECNGWRRYSADDGGFYFHNRLTGESVWNPPEGWREPPEGSRRPTSNSVAVAAVVSVDNQEMGPSRPSKVSTSEMHTDTQMSANDQEDVRKELAKDSPAAYVAPVDPAPVKAPEKEPAPARRQDDGPKEPCCGGKNFECGNGCKIACIIIFLLIIIIVLASVLTAPMAVSCHSSDEGYFVKLVPPPVLMNVFPSLICNTYNSTNLTVVGTGFLLYNGHAPVLKIAGLTLPGYDVTGCQPVEGVRDQTVYECTQFTAIFPADDGTGITNPSSVTVENYSPDAHPVAKQSSPCESTITDYAYVAPAPTLSSVFPNAACSGAYQTVTITGQSFFSYQSINGSMWINPTIVSDNGYRVSPSTVTMDNCDPVFLSQYAQAQVCTGIIFSVMAGFLNTVNTFTVYNPSSAGINCPSITVQNTLYVVPQPVISNISQLAVCSDTGGTLVITGTFPQIGTTNPTVTLNGMSLAATFSGCAAFGTATDVQICTSASLVVPANAVPIVSSYYVVPTLQVNVTSLSGCTVSANAFAIFSPPSFVPLSLPALCPADTANQVVSYNGNFMLYGASDTTFTVNGAAFPVINSNPKYCTNVVSFAGQTVYECSEYDLLIQNPTPLPPTDIPVTATFPSPVTCAAPSTSPNPMLKAVAPTLTGSTNLTMCLNQPQLIQLTGSFLTQNGAFPVITANAPFSATARASQYSVDPTTCTSFTASSQTCTSITFMINVPGFIAGPVDFTVAVGGCSASLTAVLTGALC